MLSKVSFTGSKTIPSSNLVRVFNKIIIIVVGWDRQLLPKIVKCVRTACLNYYVFDSL